MPASVKWHPVYDHTVLHMEITGLLKIDELNQAIAIEGEHIQQADRPIHTIIDLRANTNLAPQFMSNLPRIGQSPAMTHPNVGLKIGVGAKNAARAAISLASQIFRKIHIVDTLEEAYQLIEEFEEQHRAEKSQS